MFWSPAEATLSVCACAAAGSASAVAASAAAKTVLRMNSSLVVGAWEQVQGPDRQAQADRGVELEMAVVGDREMTVTDRDAVAVVSARIGPLRNPARQHDGALDPRVRRVELRHVVAEVRRHGAGPGRARPGHRRLPAGPDGDAARRRRDLELDRVLGPHEARDE